MINPNPNNTTPVKINHIEFFKDDDITSCPEDPCPTTEYCRPTEIRRIIIPVTDTTIPRLPLFNVGVVVTAAPDTELIL